MGLVLQRIPTTDCRPAEGLAYADVFNLFPLYDTFASSGLPLGLVGPKGVGKSLSLEAWAASRGKHFIDYDCAEDTQREQLVGSHYLDAEVSPFVLGPLVSAIEVANETGFCLLLLQELASLRPAMQKHLNALTDFRRRVVVPEARQVFHLQPGATLWVTATMVEEESGTYRLNHDLRSRLRLWPLGYPTAAQEADLVTAAVGKVEQSLLNRTLVLANLTRQGFSGYIISPRDVVQIVTDIPLVGEEKALRCVLGKFEEHDRATAAQWMADTFPGTAFPEYLP